VHDVERRRQNHGLSLEIASAVTDALIFMAVAMLATRTIAARARHLNSQHSTGPARS
jgi:hypothetical protein